MNYIYKYVYENEIVYIGKTNDLKRRISEHHREEKFGNKTFDIYYFLCKSQRQADLYEYMLINKYKPALNISDKEEFEDFSYFIEPNWIKYDSNINNININNNEKCIEDSNFLIENYFSVAEAAEYANVSVSALYKRKKHGTLPHIIYNGQIYFLKKDIINDYGNNNTLKNKNDFNNKNELELLIKLAKKYNAKLIFE